MAQSPTNVENHSPSQLDEYLQGWFALHELVNRGRSFSGYERNCVFLNTDNAAFTDVSGVSGADFPEDGRGAATVDWDLDGDLDLWITNRTAPRVRLLRNNSTTTNGFLNLHLQSVTGNRDAIGTRLELYIAGRAQPLLQTLRGGEGHLSQSSKWVHFGLGSANKIDRLVVRWPTGEVEEFTDLQINQWYKLVQFEVPEPWNAPSTRTAELEDAAVALPRPSTSASRLLITRRTSAPDNIVFVDKSGTQRSLSEFAGHPVLISLWAPWCPPCLKELARFEKEYAALHDAGLVIIALNVDGLDGMRKPDPAGANRFLQDHAPHLIAGDATRPVVAELELALHRHFASRYELPLPSSMLLDSELRFAVMYAGPVSPAQLMADIELVQSRPEEIPAQSVPFAGIWIETQDPPPQPATIIPWPEEIPPPVTNGVAILLWTGAGLFGLIVVVVAGIAWATKSRGGSE